MPLLAATSHDYRVSCWPTLSDSSTQFFEWFCVSVGAEDWPKALRSKNNPEPPPYQTFLSRACREIYFTHNFALKPRSEYFDHGLSWMIMDYHGLLWIITDDHGSIFDCQEQLGDGEVYLVAATLRPETMYGQTNCFVLPEGAVHQIEKNRTDGRSTDFWGLHKFFTSFPMCQVSICFVQQNYPRFGWWPGVGFMTKWPLMAIDMGSLTKLKTSHEGNYHVSVF